MRSTVTVVTPADYETLVSLATVRAALGIRDRSRDADLTRYARQATADCERYCRRTLRAETVSQLIEFDPCESYERIVLERKPIIGAITSITPGENDPLTVTTDYTFDSRTGIVTRRSSSNATYWATGRTVIVYRGGFEEDAVDAGIEGACLRLIRDYHFGANRDPYVTSVNLPDVGSRSYAMPEPGEPGMPREVRDALDPFRKVV